MNHKIFYIHIPKCAGTSIVKLLEQVAGLRNKLCKVYDASGYVNKVETIQNGEIIFGHFGTNYYTAYTGKKMCLTMLRNPVDRILSHYSYWRVNSFNSIGCAEAKKFSLFDFLRSEHPGVKYQFENIQAWMLISGYQKEARQYYLHLSRKDLTELALERLLQFDYVGTTENYDQDVVKILNLMGITEQQQVKLVYPEEKINMTKYRLDVKDLSDQDIDLLHEFTDIDTILYNRALALHHDQ